MKEERSVYWTAPPWKTSVLLSGDILVSDLCFGRGPYGGPQAIPVTRDWAVVPGWCWRPSGYSWSVLWLETMWKPRTRAHTHCEGQGSYSCSGINDWRCIAGREEHTRPLWQPLPPPHSTKSDSLERKPSRRTLKNCVGNAVIWLPQLMASGRGSDGEGLNFSSGAGHWKFDHDPVGTWTMQNELGFHLLLFIFFLLLSLFLLLFFLFFFLPFSFSKDILGDLLIHLSVILRGDLFSIMSFCYFVILKYYWWVTG